MSKTKAPCGTWTSPVSTKLMTETAIGLSSVLVDGLDLYWLESRPHEGGRGVLNRWHLHGNIEEINPSPFNIGSRVHEYGGGAFAVKNGLIIFSERKDGNVFLIEGAAAPRQIPTPEACRYANFEFDITRNRVLAIREDHRDRPPTDPKAAIVSLPLDLTGQEEVLFEGPDFLSSPRLSPDATELAFIAWDHPFMPWNWTRLYLTPLLTDGRLAIPKLVAGLEPEAIVQPGFDKEGRLHFCSDRSDWWNLYRLEGEKIVNLAPIEAEIGGPHWVFGQHFYAFSADGQILVSIVRNGVRSAARIKNGGIEPLDLGQVQECPQAFGEGLAYIETSPFAPAAVTLREKIDAPSKLMIKAATPSPLPEAAISSGETIDFPTQNGTGHAFWYAPQSESFSPSDGELPPLIVLSHGGPTSMATNGFALNIQWWTSRGFAVVDVNYAGSTGYGRPYRHALDGQWGIADVRDCIAAATALIERGLVDGNRVVIRGGSAGGFTTLAALTSSKLFKAGASLYGVADLMLLAKDTHKFESRYLDGLVGPLPETEALYKERSPIYHLDQLSCPIIFFQGEDDKTVPPNQAETMVAAMNEQHLPVAYYAFAGEGHGFRKAETLTRVLELELDFYGRIFGFVPPGLNERVLIQNLDR